MTFLSPSKHKVLIGMDEYEALVERQFFNNETVYVLDDGTVVRTSDGIVETSWF